MRSKGSHAWPAFDFVQVVDFGSFNRATVALIPRSRRSAARSHCSRQMSASGGWCPQDVVPLLPKPAMRCWRMPARCSTSPRGPEVSCASCTPVPAAALPSGCRRRWRFVWGLAGTAVQETLSAGGIELANAGASQQRCQRTPQRAAADEQNALGTAAV